MPMWAVGLPNAGKSTLLSVLSNAKPEIADYPFTTITPNLGVVDVGKSSFLIADIPGLIEGASQGKGLGDEFLRHIERTKLLLHVIDTTNQDVLDAYQTINQELSSYRVNLGIKPQIVVLSKIDAVDESVVKEQLNTLGKKTSYPIFAISASAHKNLEKLAAAIQDALEKLSKKTEAVEEEGEIPVISVEDDPKLWWVEERKGQSGY